MTIKGLIQFINRKIPKTIQKIEDIKSFTGKKFIIDGTFYIYKFMYVAWKNIINDKNREKKFRSNSVTTHVLIRHYIIKKSIQLLKNQHEYLKSLNINTLYIIEDIGARSKLQPVDFKCKKHVWKEREILRKKKKLFDILNWDTSSYGFKSEEEKEEKEEDADDNDENDEGQDFLLEPESDMDVMERSGTRMTKKENSDDNVDGRNVLELSNSNGQGSKISESIITSEDLPLLNKQMYNFYKEKKKPKKCKMEIILDDGEEDIFKKNIFIKINSQTANDIYNHLLLENIPIFITKNDAEKECAIQCSHEKDIVVSDDIDALAFGAPNLMRFISNKKKRHIINKQELLNQLDINYEQFIDFCILSGCDYSGKIPGIGPAKAHEIIKKYDTIEKFLNSNAFEKFKNSKLFRQKLFETSMTLDDYIVNEFTYEQARKVFFNSY